MQDTASLAGALQSAILVTEGGRPMYRAGKGSARLLKEAVVRGRWVSMMVRGRLGLMRCLHLGRDCGVV